MSYYFLLSSIVFIYMNFWFFISRIKQRNDVADTAWGLGFVFIAWCSFFISGDYTVRAILINVLVTLWGVRLATHIYLRNRNKSEDYRYQEWRKQWGGSFAIRSYLQVFLLQGFFLFLISFPVLFINKSSDSPVTILDFTGVLIWVIGFFFESVGDWQLSRFLSDPKNKGRIMQSGLWMYSRHPNYFGEVTGWWGIYFIALSVSGGWVTIIGPLSITLLILFVSGIPLLEKKYSQRPEYQEYKRTTSMFIPMLPKK